MCTYELLNDVLAHLDFFMQQHRHVITPPTASIVTTPTAVAPATIPHMKTGGPELKLPGTGGVGLTAEEDKVGEERAGCKILLLNGKMSVIVQQYLQLN